MKRKLTDRTVKTLKQKDKNYRVADGGGLYVLVKSTGSKLWRYDCVISGSRVTLSFGEYPSVLLAQARELHEQARSDIARGVDPRVQNKAGAEAPFSFYARDTNRRLDLAESTLKKREQRQAKYLFPVLDKKPVSQITAIDVLNICQPIAEQGKHETAHLLATYCRQTFDTLLAMQLIDSNPAESVSRLLPKLKRSEEKQFAHVTDEKDFRVLLLGADSYQGDFAVFKALQLMPHVFLRPHNIRFMKWDYIDFEEGVITFPAEMMKMNRPHKVPMSEQVCSILLQMRDVTGGDELVFTTARGNGKPMSENTLNYAVRRLKHPETGKPLGKGFMTSHGYRHTASTLLNELRFDSDVIELQLAHLDKDRIRRTYNKAELLEERFKMMQAWSDYLDGLKANADVIPINRLAK